MPPRESLQKKVPTIWLPDRDTNESLTVILSRVNCNSPVRGSRKMSVKGSIHLPKRIEHQIRPVHTLPVQ